MKKLRFLAIVCILLTITFPLSARAAEDLALRVAETNDNPLIPENSYGDSNGYWKIEWDSVWTAETGARFYGGEVLILTSEQFEVRIEGPITSRQFQLLFAQEDDEFLVPPSLAADARDALYSLLQYEAAAAGGLSLVLGENGRYLRSLEPNRSWALVEDENAGRVVYLDVRLADNDGAFMYIRAAGPSRSEFNAHSESLESLISAIELLRIGA